jgi:lipoprotein NlpI
MSERRGRSAGRGGGGAGGWLGVLGLGLVLGMGMGMGMGWVGVSAAGERGELGGGGGAVEELGDDEDRARLREAVEFWGRAIAGSPEDEAGYRRRGELRFFLGDIAGSLEDFDRAIELKPEVMPYLWQRGISLYYAGRYREGREQFEVHQEVNRHDVENAAWHFLCHAREGGLEAAAAALIPIAGDSRVPMAEVHLLFGGEVGPEAVLAAVDEAGGGEAERRNHLCYAHLYLGLWHEARGDEEAMLAHMEKAAVEHRMDHYMGRVAQIHLALRRAGLE